MVSGSVGVEAQMLFFEDKLLVSKELCIFTTYFFAAMLMEAWRRLDGVLSGKYGRSVGQILVAILTKKKLLHQPIP